MQFLKIFFRFFFPPFLATQPHSLRNISSGSLEVDTELSIDFDSYSDVDDRVSTILPPVINGHAAQYPTSTSDKATMAVRNESDLLILKRPTSDVNDNYLAAILISNPGTKGTLRTSTSSTTVRVKSSPETTFSVERETPAVVTELTESTTRTNIFETIRTTLMSPKFVESFSEAKTGKPLITKMKKVVVVSTPETMRTYGFTSGHQNNFGVPIEEDERILKMLDEQLINRAKDPSKVGGVW